MNFLRSLFAKNKKKESVNDLIKNLTIGDIVFLEYKHPKEVGIVLGDHLTHTRLNKNEIDNRKIRGTVSAIRKEGMPLNSNLIEIATFDSPAMPGKLRKFLFLPEEIKFIRKAQ